MNPILLYICVTVIWLLSVISLVYLIFDFYICKLLILWSQEYSLSLTCGWIVLQVLAYSQQSRERANKEQATLLERMHEYKKQIDRDSRSSGNGLNDSHNVDGIQTIGRSSHKMIEAVMQSSTKGKVTFLFSTGNWRFMHTCRSYSSMDGVYIMMY